MSIFSENLKRLRKSKGLTQHRLAAETGLTRAALSSYEEGRAKPKVDTLKFLCAFYKVSLDDIFGIDPDVAENRFAYSSGQGLRVLTVAVTPDTGMVEAMPLIADKAIAGYTAGYADPEYFKSLPAFLMPFPEISGQRTYRIFQASGDSMLPIPDRAYLISEYVSDWHSVKPETACVVVTVSDGILFKRVVMNTSSDKGVVLKSDNSEFKPYSVELDQIVEIWRVVGFTTFQLP